MCMLVCIYLSFWCLLVNNIPPKVDAGPDKELTWPDNSVRLSGDQTSDDMGTKNLQYHWHIIKFALSIGLQ